MDDFSRQDWSATWSGPTLIYSNIQDTAAHAQAQDRDGALVLSAVNSGGFSVQDYRLLRRDTPLRVGQTLSAKVTLRGAPRAVAGEVSLGGGILLTEASPTPHRRDVLILYSNNAGQVAWRYYNARMRNTSGSLDGVFGPEETLELLIERTAEREYGVGYREIGGEPLRLGDPIIVVPEAPALGGSIGLHLNWDSRFAKPCGEVNVDDVAILDASPLSPVPLEAKPGDPQYLSPGEKTYFWGGESTGKVVSYQWDFGDGGSATGETVSHQFDKPGRFSVALTVSDASGSSARVVTTATVQEPVQEKALPYRAIQFGDIRSVLDDHQSLISAMEEFAALGFNRLALFNPDGEYAHPYQLFARVPQFPEVNTLSDDDLAGNAAKLRSVLDTARRLGMRVDMLVRNVFLPKALAEARGLPGEAANPFDGRGLEDSPLAREYVAAAVRAFYAAFPDFGSIILTVGEFPLNCVAYCSASYVKALREIPPQDPFILREQCIYPWEMNEMMAGYDKWALLCKFNEEQLAYPRATIRGALMHRYTGKPVIYICGRGAEPTFWGSHRFVREMVRSIRERHGIGYTLSAQQRDTEWLMQEAFARYSMDPDRDPDGEDTHFVARLRERYGPGIPAEKLLAAAETSTWILPNVRRHFFYRNWNYMPQFGLPLVAYLGMPSLGSFRMEGAYLWNSERRFSWWIPREAAFDRDFLTIAEFVGGYKSGQEMATPEDAASDLERRAQETSAVLPSVREATAEKNVDEYRKLCLRLEYAASIGSFHASKTRAAIAFEHWRQGQMNKEKAIEQVLPLLKESIDHYRRATEAYEAIYGQNAPERQFRMPGPSSGLPWPFFQTFSELDGKDLFVTKGMRQLMPVFEKEIDEIKARILAGEKQPPAFSMLWKATFGS